MPSPSADTPPPAPSTVLGVRVDAASREQVWAWTDAVDPKTGVPAGYLCPANVHVVVTARRDPALRAALEAARFVVPDGMPLVWDLRRHGHPDQERMYGPGLMLQWCARAERLGQSIYLYGSTDVTLGELVHRLREQFPKLVIAGTHSPPFRELSASEGAEVVSAINHSGASVLFIGLGAPKQELWMHAHREVVIPAMAGVGAAFDFIAQTKRQAPRWMRKRGLEWLFRMVTEPRRLAGRYLVTNSRFLLAQATQRLRRQRG